jgi:putative oxidoreductase
MTQLNRLSEIAHWLPRLALAATFLYHGIGKFPMAQGMAAMMGMPVAMVYMLATAEIVGALLILWGGAGRDWATRTSGLIFPSVMVGAIAMVHLQHGWNSINMGGGNEGKGMEFQVVILALSLFFAFKGSAAKTVSVTSSQSR